MWRGGFAPGVFEWASVEQAERDRNDQEDGLIDRAGDREQSQAGQPAQRSWNALVEGHDPDGSHGLLEEGEDASHGLLERLNLKHAVQRVVDVLGNARKRDDGHIR